MFFELIGADIFYDLIFGICETVVLFALKMDHTTGLI